MCISCKLLEYMFNEYSSTKGNLKQALCIKLAWLYRISNKLLDKYKKIDIILSKIWLESLPFAQSLKAEISSRMFILVSSL